MDFQKPIASLFRREVGAGLCGCGTRAPLIGNKLCRSWY